MDDSEADSIKKLLVQDEILKGVVVDSTDAWPNSIRRASYKK